jgi:hypothetical protein
VTVDLFLLALAVVGWGAYFWERRAFRKLLRLCQRSVAREEKAHRAVEESLAREKKSHDVAAALLDARQTVHRHHGAN